MSIPDKYKFLKFFAPDPALQENTDPLTHHLPPLTLTLSQEVQSLISKIRDSVAVVSSLGFSQQFFSLVRKMLMLQQIRGQQSPRRISAHPINELQFYNKIEIGLSQPVEWMYTALRLKLVSKLQFESPIKLNCDQDIKVQNEAIERIITANLVMSMVIIYQVTEQRHIFQLSKIIAAFQQKTSNLMHPIFPSFFLLYNSQLLSSEMIQQQLQQWTNKGVAFQLIQTLQSQQMSWSEQHKLISYSKLITGSLKTKIINKSTLTPKMLIKFLATYLGEGQQSDDTILSAWQKAQLTQADELAQSALSEYMSKIEEITEGKNLLGVNFFKQMQAKVRNDIIKQVSDRAIKSGVGEQVIKTERKLLQCKEELESKNKWSILSWGREFLKQSYATLQKKLGKDIKSIQAYKQEMQLFIDFFKKKSEQYLTLDLSLLFNDFALTKMFEAVQQINTTQITQLQQQSKSLQAQIATFTSENKELKKKNNKQESQIARKYNQLKEKNMLLETRCELVERSSELLKDEIAQTKQKYQDKLAKISQKHYLEIKEVRQECESLKQMEEQITKKCALLQCELSKEKLLHEQTQTYYRQMIDSYKDKEQQFKDQILQISMNSNRQLDLLKQSSHRENQDHHLNRQQMHIKVTELEFTIKQKDNQLLELKAQIQSIKMSKSGKMQSIQSKLTDLQLRNRLLEEKQVECDILKNKLKKNEEQIKRLSKEKDQQLQLCKEAEKQNLITQQKCEYLEQSLAGQKTKYREAAQSYQKIKNQKDQLQQKMALQERKIVADEWVQVQDTVHKEKLRTALQIIRELEGEYNRIRAEVEWAKRGNEGNFRSN